MPEPMRFRDSRQRRDNKLYKDGIGNIAGRVPETKLRDPFFVDI